MKDATVKIAITPANKHFTVNTSGTAATLKKGTFYAGFTKGKWQQVSSLSDAQENQIPFVLESSDSLVVFNGHVTTVAALLQSECGIKHALKPVKYHKKNDNPLPGNPGHFTLETEHYIVYGLSAMPTTEKDGKKVIANGIIGSAMPMNAWENKYLKILWSVRWCATGLNAIRPAVYVVHDMEIPAEQALEHSPMMPNI